MDILKKLKKKKEENSPFSELVKKRPKEKEEEEKKKKDEDIEVKTLKVDGESASPVPTDSSSTPDHSGSPVAPSQQEEDVLHASGMRELDFDSGGGGKTDLTTLKEDYLKRVCDLVRNDKIADAIDLLDELSRRMIGGSDA